MIYQHTNMQTYQHTSMQTCKPITMVIYIAGSISLFRGKRSNRFRLQRQSKHGALRRLKVRRLRRFPINLPLASLRAYLSGKPCIRPPRAKEPLKTETTAPPPTDRKEKIRWGYGQAGGRDSHSRKADGQADGTPQGIYGENTVAY